jgi:hypothetical protein
VSTQSGRFACGIACLHYGATAQLVGRGDSNGSLDHALPPSKLEDATGIDDRARLHTAFTTHRQHTNGQCIVPPPQ